jgi:hypothetical protein
MKIIFMGIEECGGKYLSDLFKGNNLDLPINSMSGIGGIYDYKYKLRPNCFLVHFILDPTIAIPIIANNIEKYATDPIIKTLIKYKNTIEQAILIYMHLNTITNSKAVIKIERCYEDINKILSDNGFTFNVNNIPFTSSIPYKRYWNDINTELYNDFRQFCGKFNYIILNNQLPANIGNPSLIKNIMMPSVRNAPQYNNGINIINNSSDIIKPRYSRKTLEPWQTM